jgi:hypothetical protein
MASSVKTHRSFRDALALSQKQVRQLAEALATTLSAITSGWWRRCCSAMPSSEKPYARLPVHSPGRGSRSGLRTAWRAVHQRSQPAQATRASRSASRTKRRRFLKRFPLDLKRGDPH